MKEFNITGTCIPHMHYMVDTKSKIESVIELVEKDKYFTINRSRQFGKTTTLYLIKNVLRKRMEVISISFEGVGDGPFKNNVYFANCFVDLVYDQMEFTNIREEDREQWNTSSEINEQNAIKWLSRKITALCKKYTVVLMIDEMDKCSDNQVFLNLLGMLREKYLSRNMGEDYTFKSVIMASVYDVKNLKLKLRPDEERKYNSPWNIAVDFTIDLSFHPEEIATMLEAYEKDANTGMDIGVISNELYKYTNGYPYLVSWICRWIEEQGNREWNSEGIRKAVKYYYISDSTLKDDLIKNFENNPALKEMITAMILMGKEYAYVSTDEAVNLGLTFGIFKKQEMSPDNTEIINKLEISNIIFANILTEHILFKADRESSYIYPEKSQFIKEDGHLDMVRILDKFQEFMKSEYRQEDEKFVEREGRLLFLCFLKPIINGTGFYYVEPQTRNNSRMDIVVSYLQEEFIIELKIWRGDMYRRDGLKQLNTYMDSRNQKKGYLVSFSFLKDKEYRAGLVADIKNEDVPGIEDKEIYEVVV